MSRRNRSSDRVSHMSPHRAESRWKNRKYRAAEKRAAGALDVDALRRELVRA